MIHFEKVEEHLKSFKGLQPLTGEALNSIKVIAENPEGHNTISLTRTAVNGEPKIVLNGKAKNDKMGDFEVKNSNEISNSRYQGTGYQTPLDTLTVLSTQAVEQAFLKENNRLSDVIQTQTGVAPYAKTLEYEVMGNSASTVWDHEIPVNHEGAVRGVDRQNTFYKSQRGIFAYSLGYTELEMRQGAVSGIQAFQLTQRMEGLMNVIMQHKEQLRAFGRKNADGSYFGGMFNYNGAVANASVLPKSISEMSPAEINLFVKDLTENFTENTNTGGTIKKLIFPSFDVNSGFGKVDNTRTAGVITYKDLIMKPLQDATGMDIEIIASHYASKKFNQNFGIDKDFYVALDDQQALAYFDVPVDIQVLLQPAQYGMGVRTILVMQAGECVVRRPEYFKIYNPAN